MKYLLALICLCLPAYLIRFSIFGIPTTVLEILIYAVFIIGLIFYFQKRTQFNPSISLRTGNPIWWPIGLLILAALISVFISPLRAVALGQFKAFFIDPLLVFWLVLVYLKKEDFPWLIGGLAGSSLIVSVHAIFQKIMGQVTPDGRVIGIFGYSPNYLALFLAPIIALLIVYGIELIKIKNNKSLVIGYWLLVILDFAALYFSGSRGGLLALAGGLVFYFLIKYWADLSKKLWLKIIVLIMILIVVVGAGFVFRPDFSVTTGRISTSNNVRWQIWQTSIEMVRNKPLLGVGLANFQNAFGELTKDRANFPEYITPMALTPHNVFLMFYLTTGLLGLIAFVWLLIIFYRQGFKNPNGYSLILMTGFMTYVLQGLVDAQYFKNDLSMIFWLLMGMMIVLNKESI